MKLRNEFHRTEVEVRPRRTPGGDYIFSARQVRRARRLLCGLPGCKCGGNLGERPAFAPLLDRRESGELVFEGCAREE